MLLTQVSSKESLEGYRSGVLNGTSKSMKGEKTTLYGLVQCSNSISYARNYALCHKLC